MIAFQQKTFSTLSHSRIISGQFAGSFDHEKEKEAEKLTTTSDKIEQKINTPVKYKAVKKDFSTNLKKEFYDKNSQLGKALTSTLRNLIIVLGHTLIAGLHAPTAGVSVVLHVVWYFTAKYVTNSEAVKRQIDQLTAWTAPKNLEKTKEILLSGLNNYLTKLNKLQNLKTSEDNSELSTQVLTDLLKELSVSNPELFKTKKQQKELAIFNEISDLYTSINGKNRFRDLDNPTQIQFTESIIKLIESQNKEFQSLALTLLDNAGASADSRATANLLIDYVNSLPPKQSIDS
jgi:hypothetical protein